MKDSGAAHPFGANGPRFEESRTIEIMNAELVHFEGDFSSQEKERIVAVLEEAEEQLAEPDWRFEFGALWIVSSTDVPDHSRVVTAHRMGADRALVAKTLEEFTSRVQSFVRREARS